MTRFLFVAGVAALVLTSVGRGGTAAPGVSAPGAAASGVLTSAAQQTAPAGSVQAAAQGSTSAPAGSSPGSALPGPLDRLVERYWDAYLELNPLRATASGDHRTDDRLENSISPQYLADSLALERHALAELLSLPVPAENSPARLTYELFKRGRELTIEGYLYPEELFPVDPFEGMAQDFAVMGSGAGPQPFATAKDYENWLRRIDGFALWTEQAIDNLRSGIRRGYLAPRALVEELLPQLAALGQDDPANPFYRPLSSMPSTIDEPHRAALSMRFASAVKAKVLPAYRGLHDFLQDEYLPLAPEQGSWSRLPLGEAWYAYLVRKQTSVQLTPAQVHRLSLAEVERLRGRVQALLNEAGFSGNAQAYFDLLRHEPRAVFGSPAERLGAYRELQTRIDSAAPAVLNGLPAVPVIIQAAPHFFSAFNPPLAYRGATPDGNFPATLDVNSAPASRYDFQIGPLLLGAYLPGRHAQFVVQRAARDLPRFRKFGATPAFVDGWALYAQSLGEPMGLAREPAARFAALLDELAHASIAAVDSGLHANGWTRAAAIDYLHAQLPIEDETAVVAVDRALAEPARALSAEIGAMRIRELRRRAEEKLGSRFDLPAFHATILEAGALPLDLLEQRVQRWIDATNALSR